MTELRPCPFCGASEDMLYHVDKANPLEPLDDFKSPAIFCDACKATVYFEDSTSLGISDAEDYKVLSDKLIEGWNSRQTATVGSYKVAAIKALHVLTGASLSDCKAFYDAAQARKSTADPTSYIAPNHTTGNVV